MLLRCRSVHTFGMAVPISVVALDADGVVLASAVVVPRRVRIFRRAVWIVETAPGDLPAAGERATVLPILTGWPAP